MIKIKIVRGVYGHVSNGSTIPKNKNSEPFLVTETKAKELIEAGIAVLATELKSEAEKPIKYSESLAPVCNIVDKSKPQEPVQEQNEKQSDDNDENESNELVYSMENTQKELLSFARSLGFEGKDNATKQQLIDFLDQATSTDDNMPVIDDNEGVVD